MIEIVLYEGEEVRARHRSDSIARLAGVEPEDAEALLRELDRRKLLFGSFRDDHLPNPASETFEERHRRAHREIRSRRRQEKLIGGVPESVVEALEDRRGR